MLRTAGTQAALLRRDRRCGVAVLTGLLALPIVGIVGVAIDFTMLHQTYAALRLAADGAALNAAKIAASGELAGDANYVAEGETAGRQWFVVQTGSYAGSLSSTTPVVNVTPGLTITATVTFSGTTPSIFGKVFGVGTYSLAVEAGATVQIAPYLNLTVLIDNSPSMLIGASPSDIATLQQLTPCAPSGAYYPNASGNYHTKPLSGQVYEAYQCVYGTNTYNGSLACPIPATSPYTFSTFALVAANSGSYNTGPSCQGYLSAQSPSGKYPMAGPPCAFACHFDTSVPAGTGNDYFAVARGTIGKSNQITLRFDVVKAAVNAMLTQTQARDTYGTLAVNIFTFDTALNPLYPTDGSYTSDWATAMTYVGTRATSPNTPDTGLQPYGGPDSKNTDFPQAMSTLIGTYLTAAGTGLSAGSPRKALVLVTDGMQDTVSNGSNEAFSPAMCQTLKDMGFTVFVLYTTYYPLMNKTYLANLTSVAEGSGPSSIAYNLSECASTPDDFIEASDGPAITTGLQTLLSLALTTQTRLTK